MSGISCHITPAPENMRMMGPADAPVPRLKAEYRYQLLIESGSRKDLNALTSSTIQASVRWCCYRHKDLFFP
jgi:primosomal protein N'